MTTEVVLWHCLHEIGMNHYSDMEEGHIHEQMEALCPEVAIKALINLIAMTKEIHGREFDTYTNEKLEGASEELKCALMQLEKE